MPPTPAVTYQLALDAVDWTEMKATLDQDHFDNGRSPAQLRASFENSFAACVAYADGQIVGLVSVSDVQRVPPERWTTTPLRAIMTPAASLAVIEPQHSLQEAAARLDARGVNQLPVVRDGALVGMLSRADVGRFLRLSAEPARPPGG